MLLGFLLSSKAQALAPTYTMEDLITLEGEKSHRELLLHAHDIRPSKRDESWKKILQHAGSAYLIERTQQKDFRGPTFDFIQEITQWAGLKEDAYFHAKRDTYMLSYIEHCLAISSFSLCQEKTKRAWSLSNKNRGTGVSLAQRLAEKREEEADIFFFTQETLLSDFGAFYCKRPFLLKALGKRLHEETLPLARPSQVATRVDKVVGASCFEVFSQTLLEDLEGPSERRRDFAYKILSSKGLVPESSEDLYLARYLLNAPSPGRLFNLAWAKLKEVARDHKRREVLVGKLKALDPLPDALFRSGDELKKRTMARFFYRTIPEFMDHYVEVCLNFLGGQGLFPRGNPTVHCNEFFQATQGMPLPEEQIRLRYSGLKRFRSE